MKKHFLRLMVTLSTLIPTGAFPAFAAGDSPSPSASESSVPPWVFLIIFGVVLLAAVIVVICLLLRKSNRFSRSGRTGSLTGLKNLKAIRQYYENTINDFGTYHSLVYIACNYRHAVERCGAIQCEAVLKGEAEILKSFCRDDDNLSTADKGEFILNLQCRDGLHAEQRVAEIMKRMKNYQHQTLLEDVTPFTAGICPPESTPLSFDSALTKAKLAYRFACDNCIPFYTCTADLVLNEVSRNRLRDHLNDAIDAGQFDMFLQFIYDIGKKCFSNAEALSRWNNPTEGFLMPAAYINDMRMTGVMERFDYYMLEKVCRQLAEWEGTEFDGITISCNVTRITISSVDFSKKLNAILSKYRFDRRKLILEVTEDALIDSQTMAHRNILECKNNGCKVAIDDFGAGNTSIGDLSDYPVDIIKVDRHMVTKTTGSERGTLLLRGLVDLAHQLDITVVCEGVETKRQADTVIRNNCDFIQGYFYSYVLPIEEAKSFYRNAVMNGTYGKTE